MRGGANARQAQLHIGVFRVVEHKTEGGADELAGDRGDSRARDTSMRGKPRRPKIRMGSSTMLHTAPTICEIIERFVRPVACKSRSP